MKIETKFELDDTVFYLDNNKVQQGTIVNISIEIKTKGKDMGYCYEEEYVVFGDTPVEKESKEIFTSKKDLIETL